MFKACENEAKCSVSSEHYQIFQGRGVAPLNAFGVLIFLPKMNPLNKILDLPLEGIQFLKLLVQTSVTGHFISESRTLIKLVLLDIVYVE